MTANGSGSIRTDPTSEVPLREIALEALLGREEAHFASGLAADRIRGQVVMVTGAAGSIGSELCRQIAALQPRALVGFDHAETPMFYLERELSREFPLLAFHSEIGSATRFADVDWTMRHHRPSIVFHAAAYKHVPLMETQIFAAVENNVFGTWNAARAAALHAVEQFVLISSDKAVRPASIMGATKRVAELAIGALQQRTGTRFLSVRFGNVLGSSGSVVPIFKEQIEASGPVTVTHPEMKRYFMTASEAAQLVLESAVLGEGGEVFVLDMGEPVRILELAQKLIRLSGLRPDLDIAIEFAGMRPGEKLFEELNLHHQNLVPTSHPKIRSLIDSLPAEDLNLQSSLFQMRQALEARDSSHLVRLLKALLPDYCPGGKPQIDTIPIDGEQEARLDPMGGSPSLACRQ